MAKHGWDENGFDYLVVNGEGRPMMAGRVLPMRPNSTTFRWYVFRHAGHPAASGAEPTHEAARQAVERIIQARARPMPAMLEAEPGSQTPRTS